MKGSTRAILLSALILPGAGHFYLKRVRRGLLFASVAVCCAIALIVVVSTGTWNGLEERAEACMDIGMQALVDSALSALRTAELWVLPPLSVCWLWALLDTVKIGKT